jgi:hypothetical protein
MIKACIGIIDYARQMPSRIPDTSHDTGEDKLVSLLLAVFCRSHSGIQRERGRRSAKHAHHQALAKVRVSGDSLDFRIQEFHSFKRRLRKMAIVE